MDDDLADGFRAKSFNTSPSEQRFCDHLKGATMPKKHKILGVFKVTFAGGKRQEVSFTMRGDQVYLGDSLVSHGEPEIDASWEAELKLKVTKRNPKIRDVTWHPASPTPVIQ